MPTQECGVCEARVSLTDCTHVLVNPPDEAVFDGYVCSRCYEAEVGSLFDRDELADRS